MFFLQFSPLLRNVAVILRWYRKLGGEILTVGSDAHHVSDLGAGSNRALALARETGFRAICSFANRRIRWFDL